GSIKFVLPFVLVVTPALIMRGEPLEVILTISACTLAVFVMAAGFEGYLYWVGRIGWPVRIFTLVIAAGLLYTNYYSYLVAIIALLLLYGFLFLFKRRQPGAP
ncbi:MAG: hypothetical protein ACR2PI_18115, partial [Hyphomicrobiaceae bacterium]